MRLPHERLIVYIAAKFTLGDPAANTHDVILVADQIQAGGMFTAYPPHLNILWDMVCPHEPQFWLDYDLAFLNRCDVLLRIPGESPGADREVAFAKERGIPVFYSIAELMEWGSDHG